MSLNKKNKIIWVIVEGKSDIQSLRGYLSMFFDRIDENTVLEFVQLNKNGVIIGGDITTEIYGYDKNGKMIWVNPQNIEKAISKKILSHYFDISGLKPEDISEIIQIVDTDGAFIPNDNVVVGPNAVRFESVQYFNEKIECKDEESKKRIIDRNIQKKKNLNYLCNKKSILVNQVAIPYSIYFFSSNLDHYLHFESNMRDDLKMKKANEFARLFPRTPVESFVKRFTLDPDAVQGKSYTESWEYIRESVNSLNRHTNLNILLSTRIKKHRLDI